MWLKLFPILLLILITIHQGMSQTQPPKTADGKLKNIQNTFVDMEQKVKNSIKNAESEINNTINVVKKMNNKSFSNFSKELKETKNVVSNMKIDLNFTEKTSPNITCNNVAPMISAIVFDMEKLQKVQTDLEKNLMQITVLMRKIMQANSYQDISTNDGPLIQVDSLIGALEDLVANMNEFGSALFEQMPKYMQINVDLVNFKRDNCACPTAKLSMNNVDRKIKSHQAAIEICEGKIRKYSNVSVAKVQKKIKNYEKYHR
jgi:hypothetical protein